MKITRSTLYRLAAVAAIISGISYALIQVTHPANVAESLNTQMWGVAHGFNLAFAFFGLLGVVGIYALQAEKSGWLGLIGFAMFFSAMALMMNFAFYEAYVLPPLSLEAPNFTAASFSIFDGGSGPGLMGMWFNINGILYLGGGVLFGVSMLRAKVYSRWPVIVFTAGLFGSLLNAVSTTLGRGSTMVVGASLVWLAIELWTKAAPAKQSAYAIPAQQPAHQ